MSLGGMETPGPGPRKSKYAEERASTKGKRNWDWRNDPDGQMALLCLAFFVEDRMRITQALCNSDYAKFGVTRKTTYAYLQRAVPSLFSSYERDMGIPLSDKLPMARIYMWFLKHVRKGEGCIKTITDEYPFRWATPEQQIAAYEIHKQAG